MSCLCAIFLIACKGSVQYRGKWKAIDLTGAKNEIVFDAKSFTIKDSSGNIRKFEYVQQSVNIVNSVETFGIKLGDGRVYQIHFPIAKNDSLGLINDATGSPVYTISRSEYKTYDDIVKLE